MNYRERYEEWLSNPNIDKQTKEELKNLSSEEEIEDRFYRDLEFGTAGLRGKLGAGTNRMNPYVVRKTTQGLANTIKKYGDVAMKRGVVIARDVRIMSKEFCEIAAEVLAANGITTYLFHDIQPTPMLSFAVRNLKTISGIVITASHNPQEYNGYKVYWEEGSQILEDKANEILEEINKVDLETVQRITLEEGFQKKLIHWVDRDIEEAYFKETLKRKVSDDIDKNISVVYSPLNGTGNIPVRHVLKERGFSNIFVVPEQEKPDGTFETVGYPNPEDIKAFDYALRYGKERKADLIFVTDPDCDRVAMMGDKGNNEYYAFNGNQTGALMLNYILRVRQEAGDLPKNAGVVKSIVTGDLGFAIAKDLGVNTFQTLTGFKNICALPNLWDTTKEYEFIFGYEESIGYVYGNHVRDKDAVISSMILVEMAAFYKKRGKTLYDVLMNIYEKYGFYQEELISISLDGKEGISRIQRMMEEVRKNPITDVSGILVKNIVDFIYGYSETYPLGATNLLKYELEDGSYFFLRPSGTEPKIKLYIYVISNNLEEGKKKLRSIKEGVIGVLESIE